jgi:hypothetical protein
MGATSGAGTAYFSGTFEFNPGLMWGSCCSSFSFLCGVALCFMQIGHAYSANSSCIFRKTTRSTIYIMEMEIPAERPFTSTEKVWRD